jgi:hypothetical protein
MEIEGPDVGQGGTVELAAPEEAMTTIRDYSGMRW